MKDKKKNEIKEIYIELDNENKEKMELLAVSLLNAQMIADNEKTIKLPEDLKNE